MGAVVLEETDIKLRCSTPESLRMRVTMMTVQTIQGFMSSNTVAKSYSGRKNVISFHTMGKRLRLLTNPGTSREQILRKRVLLVQLFQVVGLSEVVGHVHSLSFAAVSFISFNLNIVCFLALLEQVLFSDLLFLFETVLELFAHSSLSAVNKFEDFSDLVGNVGKYNEPAVRVVHLLDHISDFFA